MDWSDFFAGIAVLISILSLYVTRRTLFVNTVTTERMKWINSVRDNISTFTGLTYNWVASGTEDETAGEPSKDADRQKARDAMVLQIDKLRVLIKLQMNPGEKLGQDIMQKLDEIMGLTHKYHIGKLKAASDQLVSLSQTLLKEEWDKVKDEAHAGYFKDLGRYWRGVRRRRSLN